MCLQLILIHTPRTNALETSLALSRPLDEVSYTHKLLLARSLVVNGFVQLLVVDGAAAHSLIMILRAQAPRT